MANGTQNRGTKFEICVTPQPNNLTRVQLEELDYIEVCCLSELPPFTAEANMISANCIDGGKLRGVGADSESDFTVSVFYQHGCEGQDELRDMALAKDGVAYAVRKALTDQGTGVNAKPTTSYARVIWTGFNDGGGGIDDFVTHTFTGAIVQGPLLVKRTGS